MVRRLSAICARRSEAAAASSYRCSNTSIDLLSLCGRETGERCGTEALMRVIGVLDLLGGRAVHARGGQRDHYEPVQGTGLCPITERGTGLRTGTETRPPYAEPGDAVALARWYMRDLGVSE